MAFKSFVLCAALLLYCFTLSHTLPRLHNIHKRSLRLCGKMLVEALAAICQNEYYDPSHQIMRKRTYAYSSDSYPILESSYSEEGGSYSIDPQESFEFFSMNQLPRNPRGVADECCRFPCSLQQLISYCSTDSDRK
ncbi:bombyxin G-1-like [Uloborus diversus]|uniref:bombyxin G-1-like n=1 Tax=Uloborus diversus TaxID=327109 RepID=UPI002409F072|nr:bombyxin G-1-like [Uloborus diversus]